MHEVCERSPVPVVRGAGTVSLGPDGMTVARPVLFLGLFLLERQFAAMYGTINSVFNALLNFI